MVFTTKIKQTDMPQPTPEEKAAFDLFIKEYGELVAKHHMDFMAYPTYRPTDTGQWELIIQTQAVSTKDKPIVSPFVGK